MLHGFWAWFDTLLSNHLQAILITSSIYLLFVVFLFIVSYLSVPVNNLEEFEGEFEGFIDNYKETNMWWAASLFASVIALTIGSSPGIPIDLLVLSIFFAPGLFYFHRGYPFRIKCDYLSDNIREEEEGIAFPEEGEYTIDLAISSGKNITEFIFEVEPPYGVEARNLLPVEFDVSLNQNNEIEGKIPKGVNPFRISVVLEEKNEISIPAGGATLEINEKNSGRCLTEVRLFPTQK